MIFKRLFSSNIVRNTSAVLSGNVVAQAISLLVYPLLTRIYSPDDFGALTIFLSMGGVWVIIAGGEYYNSVLLPKDDKRAVACFQLSMLSIIAGTLLCAVSLIFKNEFADWFGSAELDRWLPLLPMFVFFTALWSTIRHWYSRSKAFKAIGGYQAGLSTSNAVLKSGLGLTGMTNGGLIISATVAPAITLITSIAIHLKDNLKEFLHFDFKEIKSVAAEYSNFPKYSMPRMLLNYAIGVMPALILAPYYSVATIGFYGMAVTLSNTPVRMITNSMYSVLFQRFSSMVNSGERILPLLKRYILLIIATVVPFFAILYFILPWLTALLFGDEWRVSGELIQVMLPFLATTFITSTFCFLPDIFQKQKLTLAFEIANFAICMVAMFVGIKSGDFRLTIAILYNAYAIVWALEAVWIVWLASKYDKGLSAK